MSLPATRFALSHVGTAGDQGPHFAACIDPQVGGLFWRRQFGHRQFVWMMCPISNAAMLRTFLGRLLGQQTPGRRMIVVLDNARYHHTKLLAAFLHRHARQLRRLFLPPYSPQLAPIERVWKLTRRLATHNRYFATLPDVLKAVAACFDRWCRPNEVLRCLCCIT